MLGRKSGSTPKTGEPAWKDRTRVAGGWGVAIYVLLGPLPYPIPWWGRFIMAFIFVSIGHSTASGIVLDNVAKSGPAIVGIFRGAGVGNRRISTRDAEGGGDETPEGGPTTMIPTRRKADRGKDKKE